jgi:excinuclease ABC subunit B
MYADNITASMQLTIDETLRRREKQIRYNEAHGITPKQIIKNISQPVLQKENRADVKELRREFGIAADSGVMSAADPIVARMTRPQLEKCIADTRRLMKEAAKNLDFLQAAQYRDEIFRLEKELELK